ncbi:TPA: YSIRK-type signal peptide-containing protein [Streptococcus agalactiae]
MNNNEKKVKYFLRKTAYGLASMSAAFAVCSGIVHADTSSGISASIPHKKQVNLGAVTLKNLISKYRGNDKAIENKKYSKKLPSTGEAASPLLAIVSLIVMLSAGLITIVLKHKKN